MDAANVKAFICRDVVSPNPWWKISHVCFPVVLAPLYDTICPNPSETHLLWAAPLTHRDQTTRRPHMASFLLLLVLSLSHSCVWGRREEGNQDVSPAPVNVTGPCVTELHYEPAVAYKNTHNLMGPTTNHKTWPCLKLWCHAWAFLSGLNSNINWDSFHFRQFNLLCSSFIIIFLFTCL